MKHFDLVKIMNDVDFRGDLVVKDRKIPIKIEGIGSCQNLTNGTNMRIACSAKLDHNKDYKNSYPFAINRVIFNPPATVVFWTDGTKTVVKCNKNDTYSKEVGLAMAIAKKAYGNNDSFRSVFNTFIPNYTETDKPKKTVERPVLETGKIFEQFKRRYPERARDVVDYRPCKPPYASTTLKNAIVIYTKHNTRFVYTYEWLIK